MAERKYDSIGPIPEKYGALGAISRGARWLRDKANKVDVPILGPAGDLLVGKAPEEIEAWSQGDSPFFMPEMGPRVPQVKRGRKEGLADAGFFAVDVGPLANIAHKAAGRQINKVGTKQARKLAEKTGELVGRGALPGTAVVKPRGGNWVPDSLDNYLQDLSPQRFNDHDREFGYQVAMPEAQLENEMRRRAAIDKWLTTQLRRYIMTDMGTPNDPLRALEQQGVTHFGGLQGLRNEADAAGLSADVGPFSNDYSLNRASDRIHRELTATPEAPDGRRVRSDWERLADAAIAGGNFPHGNQAGWANPQQPYLDPTRAKALVGEFAMNVHDVPYVSRMLEEPDFVPNFDAYSGSEKAEKAQRWLDSKDYAEPYQWLNKPGMERTPLWRLDPGLWRNADYLNFAHVVDYLDQSGLTPEQLSRVSVPDAVRATHEWNQRLAKQKITEDLNPAGVIHEYKTYPENGMRWVEIGPGPNSHSEEAFAGGYDAPSKRRALEAALRAEGQHMGHCVGGYCDDVERGTSRIFSLRDKDGYPHVTIETIPGRTPGDFLTEDDVVGMLPKEKLHDLYDRYSTFVNERGLQQSMGLIDFMKGYDPTLYDSLRNTQRPDKISQIKGKQNRGPVEEYLPYVQDFVRSGKWNPLIGDFRNTGLLRRSDFADDGWGALPWPEDQWFEQDSARNQIRQMYDWDTRNIWDAFSKTLPPDDNYFTAKQFQDWVASQVPPQKKASGGLVDEVQGNMMEIMNGH